MNSRLFLLLFISIVTTGCLATRPSQTGSGSTEPKPVDISQEEREKARILNEGYWLLPQIRGERYNRFVAEGLNLTDTYVYSSNSVSLNQAALRVEISGEASGSASFISAKGLVLTDYLVALRGIESAIEERGRKLEKGYYAETFGEEIALENYSLLLPVEQVEVTDHFIPAYADTVGLRKRWQMIESIKNQLINRRKNGNPDLKVDIDEMWGGNRKFMTVYKVIRDVRLVYAPSYSIASPEGLDGYWKWPRTSGSFALLRAYTGPDGSGRPFHKANTPYRPDIHLPLGRNGVDEGDFVFTLGYPAETHRMGSSYALEFYRDIESKMRMKASRSIFNALEFETRGNPDSAAVSLARRASLAYSLAYFENIKAGFESYDIVRQRKEIEEEFKAWYESDSTRAGRYGRVLQQLDQAYDIASQTGDLLYATFNPLQNSKLIEIAGLYAPYYDFLDNPDSLDFSDERRNSLLKKHRDIMDSMNIDAQAMMLEQMMRTVAELPENKQLLFFVLRFEGKGQKMDSSINSFLAKQQNSSIVFNVSAARELLNMPVDTAATLPADEMVELYNELSDSFEFSRKNYVQHFLYLRPAQRRYIEGMLEFRELDLSYPDANGTMRFTGGDVAGVSHADSAESSAFTYIDTLMRHFEQAGEEGTAGLLRNAMMNDSTGNKHNLRKKNLPIAFLSTNEMTFGSLGSPTLNGNGELTGMVIDGNSGSPTGVYYTGNENRRSIHLDVRYILFLLENMGEADRILDELKIR